MILRILCMHDFPVRLFNPAFRGCQNPINGLCLWYERQLLSLAGEEEKHDAADKLPYTAIKRRSHSYDCDATATRNKPVHFYRAMLSIGGTV